MTNKKLFVFGFLFVFLFVGVSLSQAREGISCSGSSCEIYKTNDLEYSLELSRELPSWYPIFPSETIKDGAIKIKNVDNSDTATYVSLVALVASFFGPVFVYRLQKNQSIRDEFLVRQIIYPEYVKPLTEFSLWVNSLNNTQNKDQEKLNEFLEKYSLALKTLSSYYLMARTMGVVLNELDMKKGLEIVQDNFLEFYSSDENKSEILVNVENLNVSITSFNICVYSSMNSLQHGPSIWSKIHMQFLRVKNWCNKFC